jgi:hypothetical protein
MVSIGAVPSDVTPSDVIGSATFGVRYEARNPGDGVEHFSKGGLSVARFSLGQLTVTVTVGVYTILFGVQTQEAGPAGRFVQSTSHFGDSLMPKLGQWAKMFGPSIKVEDRNPTGLGAASGAPGVPLGVAISKARQLKSFFREEEHIDFIGNYGVRSNFAVVLSGFKSELEGNAWTGVNPQCLSWIVSMEEMVDGVCLGLTR